MVVGLLTTCTRECAAVKTGRRWKSYWWYRNTTKNTNTRKKEIQIQRKIKYKYKELVHQRVCRDQDWEELEVILVMMMMMIVTIMMVIRSVKVVIIMEMKNGCRGHKQLTDMDIQDLLLFNL